MAQTMQLTSSGPALVVVPPRHCGMLLSCKNCNKTFSYSSNKTVMSEKNTYAQTM
jgi:hypothetical protein